MANPERYTLGQVIRYALKPSPGQRSFTWDESKHPRDAGGKFAEVGDRFTIHDKIPMATTWKDVEVLGVDDDGQVQLGYAEDTDKRPRTKVPAAEFDAFKGDLGGYVHNPDNEVSTDQAINGILQGRGEFLGKGQDGAAFGIGDKVVKVSTGTGFHWDQPGRGQAMGARMLLEQANVNNEMIAKGVPGLLPMKIEQKAGKTFAAMDRLEIPDDAPGLRVPKFEPHQAKQLYETIDAMHKAGYTLNDTVQAGVDENGDARLFDTGQVTPIGNISPEAKRDRLKNDRGRLRDIYEAAGLEPVFFPDEVEEKFHSTLGLAERVVKRIEDGKNIPGAAIRALNMYDRDLAKLEAFNPEAHETMQEWTGDLREVLVAQVEADRQARAAEGKPEEKFRQVGDPEKHQAQRFGTLERYAHKPSPGQRGLWSEADHPRDEGGQFTTKESPSSAKPTAKSKLPYTTIPSVGRAADSADGNYIGVAPDQNLPKVEAWINKSAPEKHQQPGQPERYRVSEAEEATEQGGEWKSLGGAPAFISDGGQILAACEGLEGEDIDEIGEGEDPLNRARRDARQDSAEARG